MFAMRLHAPHSALHPEILPTPDVSKGEIRGRVLACGVCRTDLHVVDGDLPFPGHPLTPGHEVVAEVEKVGEDVRHIQPGDWVGIPWLGHTCGTCIYCRTGHENLCNHPLFTGYTRDGGYATHIVADAHFSFVIPKKHSPEKIAPLLCAGLIGWRAIKKTDRAKKIGLYGFGAAAHIAAQVLYDQGRPFYAFTRPHDSVKQEFARKLGATWAGGSQEPPPEKLDAAIIFAPAGGLIPKALGDLKKGGRVVCAGIKMSLIPQFSYDLLWEERDICSVANLTREDGIQFLNKASELNIKTTTRSYPLKKANTALDDLRHGRFRGAAVLIP